ncbi:MAG: hypothetical protein KDA44_10540 [Planctomycetales bacterium]|nr:hypothetical protein [Planctomycetales bacterium]
MRDQRFVAAHRGGPLDRESHTLLAHWAADCAERVLPLFVRHSVDDRPQRALDIARMWARGDVETGVAMKASAAAHAAAREATDKAAIAAARSAGHAVATAHFADHCMGALLYAMKALEASGEDARAALDRQLASLPLHLRNIVAKGVYARLKPLGVLQSSDG